MNFDWDRISKPATALSAVLILAGFPIAGLWYLFTLESRVSTLERQLQVFAVPPGVNMGFGGVMAPNLAAKSVNPLDQACANLAAQVASMYENQHGSQAKDVEAVMKQLGCFARPAGESSSVSSGPTDAQPNK